MAFFLRQYRFAWFAIGLALCGASGAAGGGTTGARPDLVAGRWTEVPQSRLAAVAVSPSRGGSIRGITAWSGGAYDTDHHRMLIWGGGHSNYSGNEVYAFDVARGKWELLSHPSEPDSERTSLYPDGQPRSRHTYNYIEYVPTLGKLLSFGGSGPFPRGGGEFTRDISEFDASRGTWITGVRAAVPPLARGKGGMIGAHARWDSKTRTILFLPTTKGSIMQYDPGKDAWKVGAQTSHVRAHGTAAIDPVRRELVLIGASRDTPPQFKRWNIDKLGAEEDLTLLSTGDKAMETAYGPGFDYHSPSGCLVAWSGGPDIYLLNLSTLAWKRVSPDSASPAPAAESNKTGTYGRFRYDEGLDVFVLINGVEENVFLYRPRIEPGFCRPH